MRKAWRSVIVGLACGVVVGPLYFTNFSSENDGYPIATRAYEKDFLVNQLSDNGDTSEDVTKALLETTPLPMVAGPQLPPEMREAQGQLKGLLRYRVIRGADGPGAISVSMPPGGLLDQAGLKSGDLITAINGLTIGDSLDGDEAIALLESGGVIPVIVIRNGLPQEIVLDAASVASHL